MCACEHHSFFTRLILKWSMITNLSRMFFILLSPSSPVPSSFPPFSFSPFHHPFFYLLGPELKGFVK